MVKVGPHSVHRATSVSEYSGTCIFLVLSLLCAPDVSDKLSCEDLCFQLWTPALTLQKTILYVIFERNVGSNRCSFKRNVSHQQKVTTLFCCCCCCCCNINRKRSNYDRDEILLKAIFN